MPLFEVVVPAAEVELVTDRAWGSGATGIWEVDLGGGDVSLRVGVDPGGVDAVVAALAAWQPADVTERDAVGLATRHRTIDVAGHEVGLVVPPTVFGDGQHPTTLACLDALEELLGGADGCTGAGEPVLLLDVGCGSGVLSVAAAHLGARVTAIDIDPAAVETTRANAAAAGVPVAASTDDLSVAGRHDIVVANLSAGTLVSVAPDLVARLVPGGRLVVSGILEDRWPDVLAALGQPTVEGVVTDDGWTTAVVRPAGS